MAAADNRIASYSASSDASAVDFAMSILTESVVTPRKWWMRFFEEPHTRWHVVYDLGAREIHYRTVDSPETRSIHLDRFAFACDEPVPMLDANADLSGWIDDAFGVYDHDTNLAIFREFCDDWGIEISEEDAIALVRVFENYPCADGAR